MPGLPREPFVSPRLLKGEWRRFVKLNPGLRETYPLDSEAMVVADRAINDFRRERKRVPRQEFGHLLISRHLLQNVSERLGLDRREQSLLRRYLGVDRANYRPHFSEWARRHRAGEGLLALRGGRGEEIYQAAREEAQVLAVHYRDAIRYPIEDTFGSPNPLRNIMYAPSLRESTDFLARVHQRQLAKAAELKRGARARKP